MSPSWTEQIRINQLNPMRCVRTFSKRCCSWASSCCRHPSTPPQTETRWHLLVACSHWELAIKNAGSSRKSWAHCRAPLAYSAHSLSLKPHHVSQFLIRGASFFFSSCLTAEQLSSSYYLPLMSRANKKKKSGCSVWWIINTMYSKGKKLKNFLALLFFFRYLKNYTKHINTS